MKRIFLYNALIIVLGCIFFNSNTMAIGLGLNFSKENGTGDFEYDDNAGEPEFDTDSSYSGYGFVFDTALSKNEIFNYRLNISYGTLSQDDDVGDELKFDQWVMDHTFGFKIYRNDVLRLWVGPQLRLSYADGDKYKYEYTQWGVGISPVFGANFNIGRVITPSLTIGYRWEFINGEATGSSGLISSYDYTATNSGPFITIALLFRIDE